MSTESQNGLAIEKVTDHVQKFNLTVSRIEAINRYAGMLKVTGINDHSGLKKVVKFRRAIKDARLKTDNKRKELNADPLKLIRDNNYVAKAIITALKAPETHLRLIEKDIEQKKTARKLEKKKKALERLQQRITQLNAYEVAYEIEDVEKATDAQFSTMLDKAKYTYETAQALKQQQAKQQAVEIEKLRLENEKLKASIPPPVTETVYEPVNDAPPIDDTTSSEPVTSNAAELCEKDKQADIKAVKEYALALQAVVLPKIKIHEAKVFFLNAHSKINEGINMLLKAVAE